MAEPLLEPRLIVTENCAACRGTGSERGPDEQPCTDCGGSGREVREMPISMAWELAQRAHAKLTDPPPSMVREQAVDLTESGGEAGT